MPVVTTLQLLQERRIHYLSSGPAWSTHKGISLEATKERANRAANPTPMTAAEGPLLDSAETPASAFPAPGMLIFNLQEQSQHYATL